MSDERYPEVCVVTHPLGAAGENATRTLLEILSAITTVSLVTADLPEDSAIRDRHEVVELTDRGTGSSLPVAAARFIFNQLRMCRVIAQRDEEVVLFFGATAYLLPIAFARLIGRTVILEPRGDVPLTLRVQWEQQVPTPIATILAGVVSTLEALGYRLSNAIITYTPSMAEELGLMKFNEKLYPKGARYIDTEPFSPQIPYEDREMVVGFLGRLDQEKNVRTLATAAKDLPAEITFRFIGDGDLRAELERELADEIEEGSVEFTGWVDHDEVPGVLSELQLLVLPSAPTEGLPTVILEAMGCGTPVYATPVSGVPDIVRNDETGFLMESDRATVIRDDIVEILGRTDLDRISATGRELICEEYSFTAAVDRYQTILGEISISK
ncbi:glycosyltransferase family 4 protein [Halorubrum sp. CSM-61]|uniref:glycosyltransferase family 4 protein n=1 Tax=Halorubrum sp. CSM-61 TaxID=2485838 RepID=UPI000F4C677F|nr:glycosyltransferase [Halorubrum sp. CSM-61]